MKNTRIVVRMNASRFDVTDVKANTVFDVSEHNKEQLSTMARAICATVDIK